MSKLIAVPSIPQTNELDQAVLTYQEIQAKIKFFENELKKPKAILEAAASATADGKIVTEKYKITLTVVQRENFSLKNARATLGEAALSPFISTCAYTQLRVI
jgi:hypothetical protein